MIMYGFMAFLGCWLAMYFILPQYISLLIWFICFVLFILMAPVVFFKMHKLLLNMVAVVRTYEKIDVDYWRRVEDRADLLLLTATLMFVLEVGLIIYFLVNILK